VGPGREVGAGAEGAAGAGHDDGTDIVVTIGPVEGGDHLLLHGGVEGVGLVGPVQGDRQNLLGDLVFDGLIRHRDASLYRLQPANRRAPLDASPQSIPPIVVMDSGLAPRGASRNDKKIISAASAMAFAGRAGLRRSWPSRARRDRRSGGR